jgi:hypothetical protein
VIATAAKAARPAGEDDATRLQREGRNRDDSYSNALAAWKAQAVECEHCFLHPGPLRVYR